MQRANFIELGRVVQAVEENRKIRLTPMASQMLYSMVDAITRDPHPSWLLGDSDHAFDDFQKTMIGAIYSGLMEIPVRSGAATLSTFDLLHSVSSILDSICPFKKIPG